MLGTEFFGSLILYGIASALIVLAAVRFRFKSKFTTEESFLGGFYKSHDNTIPRAQAL